MHNALVGKDSIASIIYVITKKPEEYIFSSTQENTSKIVEKSTHCQNSLLVDLASKENEPINPAFADLNSKNSMFNIFLNWRFRVHFLTTQ